MFGSDTESPAHPKILHAVTAANKGRAASYGADDWCAAAQAALADVFETHVSAYFCASGTAANAIALSALCSPVGAVLCHREAHIERDERGACEFYTGGGKLQLLDGADGRIGLDALEAALAARHPDFVHETPAEVLSLTNLTECGTTYDHDGLAVRAELAKAHGLMVHLDGARFANAVASTKVSPADLSWRAGVDVLTFGATKNGALGCDVIVGFGDARSRWAALEARAKRGGHMPAKQRYLAAQMGAYLADDLWLALASQANDAAVQLGAGLSARPGAALAYPIEGNEVFVRLSDADRQALTKAGVGHYPWPGGSARFVCSWSTGPDDVAAALAAFTSPVGA